MNADRCWQTTRCILWVSNFHFILLFRIIMFIIFKQTFLSSHWCQHRHFFFPGLGHCLFCSFLIMDYPFFLFFYLPACVLTLAMTLYFASCLLQTQHNKCCYFEHNFTKLSVSVLCKHTKWLRNMSVMSLRIVQRFLFWLTLNERLRMQLHTDSHMFMCKRAPHHIICVCVLT